MSVLGYPLNAVRSSNCLTGCCLCNFFARSRQSCYLSVSFAYLAFFAFSLPLSAFVSLYLGVCVVPFDFVWLCHVLLLARSTILCLLCVGFDFPAFGQLRLGFCLFLQLCHVHFPFVVCLSCSLRRASGVCLALPFLFALLCAFCLAL